MQPNFGIGIQERIFEQNTPSLRAEIDLQIRQQASYWLPYIINRSISVSVAEDIPALGGDAEHGIHIVIVFSVTESGANRTIVVFGRDGISRLEVS